jgi:hypothetical protein
MGGTLAEGTQHLANDYPGQAMGVLFAGWRTGGGTGRALLVSEVDKCAARQCAAELLLPGGPRPA